VAALQAGPTSIAVASPWSQATGWRAARMPRELTFGTAGRLITSTVEPANNSAQSDSRVRLAVASEGRTNEVELTGQGSDLVATVSDRRLQCRLEGASGPVVVYEGERRYAFLLAAPKSPDALSSASGAAAAGQLVALMSGTVVKVNVSEGDSVLPGQTLAVMEAMKMEHAVQAGTAGVVRRVLCQPGQRVSAGELLIEVGAGD
jgi:biotin carboxyl carrier protein